MKNLKRYLVQHEVKIRFFFAGLFNTLVGLATFPIFYFALSSYELHYLKILSLSQIFCVCVAFITNKFLVFRTRGNYMTEFIKFISFHLAYFFINLISLPVLVEFLNFNPVTGQFLFAIVVIISSYFWHSKITFTPKNY
jgi:putative flippase GtrA